MMVFTLQETRWAFKGMIIVLPLTSILIKLFRIKADEISNYFGLKKDRLASVSQFMFIATPSLYTEMNSSV